MAIKEEIAASVELVKKLWPASFQVPDNGRPYILPKDAEALRQELKATDRFHARCLSNAHKK